MRKLLPILIIPVIAGCSTMRTADTGAVSEVVTADLARADGSWAGAVTISKRSDGIFLSLRVKRLLREPSVFTFIALENVRHRILLARAHIGIPV